MISDLPQDLIEEILSRVSVTSLRRLRSTCKLWYHQVLFKDPRFIKKYSDKTARQYHALILTDYTVCSMSSVLDRVKERISLSSVGHRLTLPHCNELVDLFRAFHCDGILLCRICRKNMIVVWNPFSGQTRWIQLQNQFLETFALGYDNKELFRSYKILTFFPYRSGRDLKRDVKVEIYEFRSNSWRNLDTTIPHGAYLKTHDGVSLNGNTYWVSCNKKGDNDYSLLSFDFSTETFQRLCAPFHHEPSYIDGTMALSVVREERLSFLYQSSKTLEVEIWMTDEIETTSVSWSKFLRVYLNFLRLSYSVSFYIIDEEKKVVVYCDEVVPVMANSRYIMTWIVKGGEKYRASADITVDRGIQVWPLRCHSFPRLFGYVPKN
ncbi:PREDICTED: putative F-box protein At3g17560 [Camelina sativa]|uniref:F-box protein At3g17560 n=1 Tax=Camelina sativa TaxID=90675 RepID=A0ABM0WYS1_CAMSA|nr:PREDICTED: putative F-box protein At3g17560 [Camelina sativa]